MNYQPENAHSSFWRIFSLTTEFCHLKKNFMTCLINDVPLRGVRRKTFFLFQFESSHSVQFSSVAPLCPTLCDPTNRSMPGLPVHHQLLKSTQTHVDDAMQLSHPLSSPSPPTLNLSQHQGLFQWVSSLHQMAKVLEFQPQHQSFQWTPRTDLL